MNHEVLTIDGAGGYPLHARHWTNPDAEELVVLVHGIVSHSLWLDSITTSLSQQGINCLAVDRRGAGLNHEDRGDAPSSAALLSDLQAVIEWSRQTGMKVHLCGFCWGANYLVNYLADNPSSEHSVMLLAPSLFPAEFIQERPFKTGSSPEATEEPVMPIENFTSGPAFESFIKPDPLRVRRVSPRLNQVLQDFSQGVWMKFLRLQLPCMVILGEKDDVVDNAATRRVFDRIPGEKHQLHVVNGRHGIQFDAPDETSALMLQWIASFR